MIRKLIDRILGRANGNGKGKRSNGNGKRHLPVRELPVLATRPPINRIAGACGDADVQEDLIVLAPIVSVPSKE